MTSRVLSPSDTDAPLLRALIGYSLEGNAQDSGEELSRCVRPFLPLLFALADRAGVPDREAAVAAMLGEVRQWCHRWESSGLPARVWVIGVAQRHLQQSAACTPGRDQTAVRR